jgi:hypothetical protein
MKMARALVGKNIGHARDEVVKWEVSVVTLVKGVKAEKVCDGSRG